MQSKRLTTRAFKYKRINYNSVRCTVDLTNLNRKVSMTRCVTHEWTQTCDKSQPTEKIHTDQRNQEAIPL
jgi:hypothetical protein